jgi:YVTN family beta-propeller protein
VFMDTATRWVHPTNVSGFDDGLAISLDGRRVYLIDWGLGTGSGRMAVLDTTKNSLIKTISLTTNPESVTVAPGGRLVYVTHFFKDMVSVVDTATLSVVRTIDIGAAVSGAAVSPNGRLLYLGGVDAVAVVETDQNAVTDRIEGDRMLTDVVISADGSRLYALGDDSTRLTVIATTDRMVIASVRLGKNPDAMGITPDGRHLYVADFATGSVSIVDTATNSVIDP